MTPSHAVPPAQYPSPAAAEPEQRPPLAGLTGRLVVAALAIAAVGFGAAPALAQTTVTTEAQLRAAFADSDETEITLGADIGLVDCVGGEIKRASTTGVVIRGAGYTVKQTCPGEGVIQSTGTGSLRMDTLTLEGGSNTQSGGAIASSGDLTVYQSTISGNTARFGGAIMGGGSIKVSASAIGGNSALRGGAIYAESGATEVVVTDSIFSYNAALPDATASDGGAIYSPGAAVTLTSSRFTGNNAIRDGGAVSALSVTVRRTTLEHNSAGVSGGAIVSTSTVTVEDSTLHGNSAGATGGAIESIGATLRNSTVNGNDASMNGGGLYARQVELAYATVVENRAQFGANLDLRRLAGEPISLDTYGSVLALPENGSNCLYPEYATITSGGYNFTDDTSCNLNGNGDTVGDDPKLATLGDNGGGTRTRMPAADSPLVDAIPTGDCHPALTLDQRRTVTRPQGKGCDIGAVERAAAAPSPSNSASPKPSDSSSPAPSTAPSPSDSGQPSNPPAPAPSSGGSGGSGGKGPGGLPLTGTAVATLLSLATVLILGGGALAALARRRRTDVS